MKPIRNALGAAALLAGSLGAAQAAVVLQEGFDNVAALGGWVINNQSSPVGATSWFQGNDAVFPSHAGAVDSYIAANFNATNPAGGVINNWLITPAFATGTSFDLSFWTRDAANGFGDRLKVYVNRTGSTNLADFTELVLSLNDSQTSGGYFADWTEVTATVAGNLNGSLARLAFVYDVSDVNLADYLGIDTLSVTAVPVPATLALALAALGLLGATARRRQA